MKQVIEIDALVEDLSSEAIVEEKLRISVVNDQINIVVEGWDSRFEVSAEHLTQALASLAPRDEPPIPKGLYTMVQHIGQKLSRLEQQVAANPHQRLDLEALSENLEALRREVLPRLVVVETWKERIEALEKERILTGQISASLQGQINSLGERVTGTDEKIAEMEERWPSALLNQLAIQCGHFENAINHLATRTATLENNLAEPPAETSALALYGGEQ